LWEVDEQGHAVEDDRGNRIALTDQRLRDIYGGKRPQPLPAIGMAAVEHHWQDLERAMAGLEGAARVLASIPSVTGRSYLEEEGWPGEEIDAMRRRLDSVDHRLHGWQDRWDARHRDDRDDNLDDEPDPDGR
jgi:hypothetical protein